MTPALPRAAWWLAAPLSLLATSAFAGPWSTVLDERANSPGYPGIATADDGTLALANRRIRRVAGRNVQETQFRTRNNGRWSSTVTLDRRFPQYPPSTYGPDVKLVLDHYVVRSGSRWVVAVLGRYSTSMLNSQGSLYAVFARSFDGATWTPWARVTPVGQMGNVDVRAGAGSTVWVGWKTSTNLAPGKVQLASFDSATFQTTTPEDVDDAIQVPMAFQGVAVAPADAGSVWVSYRAPDGLFARKRAANGTWSPRHAIVAGNDPPAHATVFADNTLWVVTSQDGIPLYKWNGSQFALDAQALFNGYNRDDGREVESLSFSMPQIARGPSGGLVVAAARSYYYELLVSPWTDRSESSLAVRTRDAAGSWGSEEIAYQRGAWNNAGGEIATSRHGVWLSATALSSLFVAEQTTSAPAPMPSREEAILRFLNEPSTDLDLLDRSASRGGVGLYRPTAQAIIAGRPFRNLYEVYDLVEVGPQSMRAIEGFVDARQALDADVLRFVNDRRTDRRTLDVTVGIDARAASWIIRFREGGRDRSVGTADDTYRPFRWIYGQTDRDALDAVPYVGRSAIQRLYDHALMQP